jgi:hypothetical protein
MLKRFWIAVAVAATSCFSHAQTTPALTPQTCEAALIHSGSFTDLTRKAQARRPVANAIKPLFITPAEDQERSKLWIGEQGPLFFQQRLPDGVTFVSHELPNNEGEGIIKVMQQKGEFIIFRVEMPWNGKKIATNVTVSAFSLADNFRSRGPGEPNYLIGPSTLAGIDWGHGGGTNSTSGSTVDAQMNSLASSNIDCHRSAATW